jgi:hypothetical protein
MQRRRKRAIVGGLAVASFSKTASNTSAICCGVESTVAVWLGPCSLSRFGALWDGKEAAADRPAPAAAAGTDAATEAGSAEMDSSTTVGCLRFADCLPLAACGPAGGS